MSMLDDDASAYARRILRRHARQRFARASRFFEAAFVDAWRARRTGADPKASNKLRKAEEACEQALATRWMVHHAGKLERENEVLRAALALGLRVRRLTYRASARIS